MKTHDNFAGGDNLARGATRRVIETTPLSAPSRAVADYENRFHAVRSGLAAVSGALHVLLDRDLAVEPGSRGQVESALMAEVERLQRLVAPVAPAVAESATEDLDVDGILADVVLARRMVGQEVAWTATGHRARGRRDDLVEVLNILLVNAWRHAQGAPSRVEVTAEGASIQILVSDDGPGVPAELRQTIFDRGVRRPGSRGQGLGLSMARELVEDAGGSLTLLPGGAGGACFCVRLQAREQSEAA
jgi:signal transduction histidine kinase